MADRQSTFAEGDLVTVKATRETGTVTGRTPDGRIKVRLGQRTRVRSESSRGMESRKFVDQTYRPDELEPRG